MLKRPVLNSTPLVSLFNQYYSGRETAFPRISASMKFSETHTRTGQITTHTSFRRKFNLEPTAFLIEIESVFESFLS